MKEKDLKVYDVWEAPNGNLFIKVCDEYSLAIGSKENHAPNKTFGDLNKTQYTKRSEIIEVKKIGKIEFKSNT